MAALGCGGQVLAAACLPAADGLISWWPGDGDAAGIALAIGAPPTITRHPDNAVVSFGATAGFQAAVDGTAPVTVHWQKDGVDLADEGEVSGAATCTLSITGVRQAHRGAYRLVATNAFGSVASDAATLVAVPVLAWGGNGSGELDIPAAASNAVHIACGQWHNLALRADGTVAGWGRNSQGQCNIPDSATNVVALAAGFDHSLALRADGSVVGWGLPGPATVPDAATNIVAISAANYHSLALTAEGSVLVWGWDTYGSTALPAAATNVVAIAGGGYFSLALRADGTVVPWGDSRYGSLNVPGGLSNAVAIAAGFDQALALRSDGSLAGWGVDFSLPPSGPSALSNILAVASGSFHTLVQYTNGNLVAWGRGDSGQTAVPPHATNVVEFDGGDFHSVALVLDTNTAVLPQVWVPPGRRLAAAGSSFALRARMGGSLPLAYQWLWNGMPIPGATRKWLSMAEAQPPQTGEYQLVASNPFGSATSEVVSVTVLSPPVWMVSPTNQTAIAGTQTALAALAGSAEALTYQWYCNGIRLADNARLSGAASNLLSIANLAVSDSGTYTVVATDRAGSSVEAAAVLTVLVPPAFTSAPRGLSAPAGLPITLSAAASGTAPLQYQWLLNGATLPGATSNVLNLAALAPGDFGDYQLVASNAAGSSTSAVARVTLGPVAVWGDYGSSIPLRPEAGLSNVIAIGAGYNYSLALRGDGTVSAWGSNPATNVPGALSGVVAIAAGLNHALALRADGSVVAWGANSSGQTNVPAQLTNVVAVTAGDSHSAALCADGSVVAWGSNLRENQTNIPPDLTKVTFIDAGAVQTLAMREDGTVVAWGGSTPMPAPPYLSGVARVSGSMTPEGPNLALLTNGTLVGWTRSGPVTNLPPGLTNLVAVEATPGQKQTSGGYLALRSNGTVVVSADSSQGLTNVPAGLSNAVAIACGVSHALALVNDGKPLIVRPPVGGTFPGGSDLVLRAKAVGELPLQFQWFARGQPIPGATNETLVIPSAPFSAAGEYCLVASNALGRAESIPAPVSIVDSPPVIVTQPASRFACCGSPFSVGASVIGSGPMQLTWLQDGTPVAADTNELVFARALPEHHGAYQLIASNAFGSVTSRLAQITFSRLAAWGSGPSLTNAPVDLGTIVGAASGAFHALAIRPDHTVAAWGTTLNAATNVPAGLSNVVAVSGGNYFSLALKADGTVAAWGLGTSGQTNVPVGLSNVVAISAGGNHAVALRRDGTVVSWGVNSYGQAAAPAGLSNAVAVAAGSVHSLALKDNGAILGWGLCGKIPAHSNVVAISAGYGQSLALQADGTVLAWSTTGAATLAPAGLTNIVAISAGGGWQGFFHCVALRADGTLVAWGNNNAAQLNIPAGLVSATSLSAGGGSSLALLNDRSPAFTVQPWSRQGALGTNVTLAALAVGQPPLHCQWYRNGILLAGQTNQLLTLPSVQPVNAGDYQLIVTNDYGSVTSALARLEVYLPPVRISSASITGSEFRLSFNSLPGPLYIIEYKDSLTAGNWTQLEQRLGNGSLETITHSMAGNTKRFYRIRVAYAP